MDRLEIEWYDYVGRSWRSLKGIMEKLSTLPKPKYGSLRLDNCGGKIVLLWEQNVLLFVVLPRRRGYCVLKLRLKNVIYKRFVGKLSGVTLSYGPCHVA